MHSSFLGWNYSKIQALKCAHALQAREQGLQAFHTRVWAALCPFLNKWNRTLYLQCIKLVGRLLLCDIIQQCSRTFLANLHMHMSHFHAYLQTMQLCVVTAFICTLIYTHRPTGCSVTSAGTPLTWLQKCTAVLPSCASTAATALSCRREELKGGVEKRRRGLRHRY
jgi:hypothetical protein